MAIIKNMNSKFGLGLSYHRITAFNINRSEERREGKECRSLWSPYN